MVFFDFETGGIKPESPNIQLAAIAVDGNFNELESFETKIAFDISKADAKALELNHYTPEAWENAPTEAFVVHQFAQFLNRHKTLSMVSRTSGRPYKVARLAGHNAHSFDAPRLQDMFRRHNAFLPAHPIALCTLQRAMWWANENCIFADSFRLEACCSLMGIELKKAHDALNDVRASIAIARFIAGQKAAA